VILSAISRCYSNSAISPCYRAYPLCYSARTFRYSAQPFFTVLDHFMILLAIFHCYGAQPFLTATILATFQSYNAQPFCHIAQSFVIMSDILESRGREVAHARARGSIACGLTTQLVMCAGPSHAGLSRMFDGVARGTGSHGRGAWGRLRACFGRFGWTVGSR
jgi:hypothetical protein